MPPKKKRKKEEIPLVVAEAAEGPTEAQKRDANARAVAASNDLGCPECDCDRPFEPIRYKFNHITGRWDLAVWKLLGGWRGPYCPKCQKKYDALKPKVVKKR